MLLKKSLFKFVKLKLMRNFILLTVILTIATLGGCSKMEEKKTNSSTTQQQMPQMPPDHGKMQTNDEAMKLSQEALDFEKVYEKDKSAKNKEELIKKNLAAGLALSPKQDMGHMNKESIRLALKHLRRVMQLDPNNKDASDELKSIEDMYKQIGRPLPEDN